MDQTNLAKVNAIALRHGIDTIPANLLALVVACYEEGRMDGALAAAQRLGMEAQAAAFAQQPSTDRRSERLERFEGDLPRAKQLHPEIDFDKQVRIAGTMYTIVGYNVRAPLKPFIIKGPQGGVYKTSVGTVQRGQQR